METKSKKKKKKKKKNEKTPKWPPFWNFGSHLENFKTLMSFSCANVDLSHFLTFEQEKTKNCTKLCTRGLPAKFKLNFTHVHVNEWDFHEYSLVFHGFGLKYRKIQHLSSKLDNRCWVAKFDNFAGQLSLGPSC